MNTTFKDILSEDYKGNVITKALPKELDNILFTLIHILGGFDTSDVINFARNANQREKRLLNKMVNDLRLYDNVGVRGFDKECIKNSSKVKLFESIIILLCLRFACLLNSSRLFKINL